VVAAHHVLQLMPNIGPIRADAIMANEKWQVAARPEEIHATGQGSAILARVRSADAVIAVEARTMVRPNRCSPCLVRKYPRCRQE